MTPKPQAKANLIHQLILSELLDNKQTVRVVKEKDPRTGKEVSRNETVKSLANNVSEFNVNLAAKRWMR